MKQNTNRMIEKLIVNGSNITDFAKGQDDKLIMAGLTGTHKIEALVYDAYCTNDSYYLIGFVNEDNIKIVPNFNTYRITANGKWQKVTEDNDDAIELNDRLIAEVEGRLINLLSDDFDVLYQSMC